MESRTLKETSKRVLVTGGEGFIGSHIVSTLLERGQTVAVADNLYSGNLNNLQSEVPFFKVDVRDETAVTSVFAEFSPTHVVHLAADSSSRIEKDAGAWAAEVNVIGSINILKATLAVAACKLIFASSAAVYGEVEGGKLATESDPVNPRSAYGASKAAFELLLTKLTLPPNLQPVVLRLATVYGPRQTLSEGVIPKFIDRLLRGEPIDLYSAVVEGDGGCERNYIYVQDVVSAIERALLEDMSGTFNVASSELHKTQDLLNELCHTLGVQAQINWRAPRTNEIKLSALSCSRLNALGWSAKTSLTDGISQTAAYFREQLQDA